PSKVGWSFAAFGVVGAIAWCASACAPEPVVVKYRSVTGPVASKRYYEVRCQEMRDCYVYAREACHQDWKIIQSLTQSKLDVNALPGVVEVGETPDYALMVECVSH